jgi:hypothetical protein
MTKKRKHHISLLPEVHATLRQMAFDRKESIGDTIAFLAGRPLVEVNMETLIAPDLGDYLMRKGYKEHGSILNVDDKEPSLDTIMNKRKQYNAL